MAVTHKLTLNYHDGTEDIFKTETFAYGGAITIDESIPANQTDLLVNCAFTIAKLKSFFMVADVAMTVKTNSSGAPQETFTLVADEPVLWTEKLTGVAVGELFGGNVTALYVTNTTTGTLRIRGTYDPT